MSFSNGSQSFDPYEYDDPPSEPGSDDQPTQQDNKSYYTDSWPLVKLTGDSRTPTASKQRRVSAVHSEHVTHE